MKRLEECRLYGFVDTAYLHGRAPDFIARQLCEGGVDLVQVRAKGATLVEVRQLARSVLAVTQPTGVGLVINDYPEIAQEIGAEFCHLGQEDFFEHGHITIDEVRPTGSALRIGLSTHRPADAQRAIAAKADYIAIGPVYATGTKPTAQPVTLDYVRWAAKNVRLPWFAIGGITLENLDDVLAAGATRVCVVSAILNAKDIAACCREFKTRLASL